MPTKTSKNCQISVSATYFMMKNFIAFSCFACLLFCGCASVNPQRSPSAAVWLYPQWRQPTGSNVRTLEVFVENHSGKAVELSDIALSAGQAAPTPLWLQVRPSGPVPAGGHAVAALCFTNTPPPFTLSLRAGGDGHAVSVPAFRMPGKLIADVAWSADSRTAYLKAESRGVPVKELLVNGRAVPFEVLKDGRTGSRLSLPRPSAPGAAPSSRRSSRTGSGPSPPVARCPAPSWTCSPPMRRQDEGSRPTRSRVEVWKWRVLVQRPAGCRCLSPPIALIAAYRRVGHLILSREKCLRISPQFAIIVASPES